MENNEYKVMRTVEKKEGKVWKENYRCENEDEVYRYLADVLRLKYIWKSPVYKTLKEERIGDGSFRKITITETDFTTNERNWREIFIIHR